jgi:hypothetical protein
MDDDDRRSNVAGAESGTEASPAPEPREMDSRERDLAAKMLRERDPHNEPARTDEDRDDVDRRP